MSEITKKAPNNTVYLQQKPKSDIMKQLLFTIILFLSGINILQAQESNPYEETTWNVIRERLFNGENSKAYRFEEDIRFQLTGEATKEDSAVIHKIISELKDLIEIVDVKLVNADGNIIFKIHSAANENTNLNYNLFKRNIFFVEIRVNATEIRTFDEKEQYFGYHIFKSLTRTFAQTKNNTSYGGVFDSQFFQPSNTIKNIDKDLVRKLYSKDFYKLLKENTVKKYGYLYYLNLRFEPWIKRASTALSIVLVIAGFLYLLSGNKIKNRTTLSKYFTRGVQVLILVICSYLLLSLPDTIPVGVKSGFWSIIFAESLQVLIIGVFSIILLFLIERTFSKKIHNFFLHQVFILFSTFSIILLSFILVSVPFVYYKLSNHPGYLLLNSSLIFNLIIIASLRVFYNFIEYKMQSIVNQKDVELAKMKELKNQAELNALHSRINPHFLYNSLNSIASLAHLNPDKTENMALALSELFRYSINKENKIFVTVEEELEMVKKYLEIEKTRFAEKLNYTITVDEMAKEKLIPKFLIQPLAENAVKHGLSKITETGKISIEVKQLENDLVIAIFDNGPDFPDEPVSGYGLQNLNDKLEILYGKQAAIYWENGNNKHFRITIKNQFKG